MTSAGPLTAPRALPAHHGPPLARRLGAFAASRAGTLALCAGLALLSLAWRVKGLGASYWIDEGISIGIASHPLAEIPGVLARDGSPPLWYMLLHGWMLAFGDGETATHALSLVFAVLVVPAALWAGWSLAGRAAGWSAAVLAAVAPYLNAYGQETRMYSLLALLGVLAVATFVNGFFLAKRRQVPVFALLLVLLLYTHGWSLFLAAAFALVLGVRIARGPDRRRLLGAGALAFGAALACFSPWLPTLAEQTAHTGAPWALAPSPWAMVDTVRTLGTGLALVGLALAAAVGLPRAYRRAAPERRGALAVLGVFVATVLLAWVASRISPAWASRYFAIVLGPLHLITGLAVARARTVGLVALALIAVGGIERGLDVPADKSNVEDVAADLGGSLPPGTLVISTQPEQTPVLSHYLPEGLRWATTLGPTSEPEVTDWRDATDRLHRTSVNRTLVPLLRTVPPGGRVLLVTPDTRSRGAFRAPWTRLVSVKTRAFAGAMGRDPRFRPVAFSSPYLGHRITTVRAVVYERRADPA